MKHKSGFIFTSARLGYRLLNESDFDNYFKLDSNPKVREFFPSGKTLDADTVKKNMKTHINFFKKHGFGVFIAVELETGEFVGRCGFGKTSTGEIEVGYVFLPAFWGKGLGTESLIALLQWAEQHVLTTDVIIAITPVGHIASQRIMQKAGMQFLKKDIQDNEECVFYKMELRK